MNGFTFSRDEQGQANLYEIQNLSDVDDISISPMLYHADLIDKWEAPLELSPV